LEETSTFSRPRRTTMKTVLRRTLKALVYLLGFAFLLAVAFYAWLVIANWSDDPLSAEAQ
jgi:cell division septal protein FtsQ